MSICELAQINYTPQMYGWIQDSTRLNSRLPRLLFTDFTTDCEAPGTVVKDLWALI